MKKSQKLRTMLFAVLALVLVIQFPVLGSASVPEVAAPAKAVNAFAIDLYGQIRKPEGNIIFSPYSISAALVMAYAGARGRTESQMAKAMHLNLEQSKVPAAFRALNDQVLSAKKENTIQINIASALWADKSQTFLKKFLELAQGGATQPGWFSRVPVLNGFMELVGLNNQGGLRQLDFQSNPASAAKTINDWVQEQTEGKIKDLFAPGTITAGTRLVLTNAIYFNGLWESPFKKKGTKEDDFFLLDGNKVKVRMMNQTAGYGYAEDAELQVLEMPYKGGELAMVVLLPAKQKRLEDFEQSVTLEKLDQWLGKLGTLAVAVFLPKFKMTSGFQLRTPLTRLGMTDAFSTGADFSGMTGNKDLFIEEGYHKAFVDVNEEGTEAAAATGLVIRMTGMPAKPKPIPVFRADHPFLFLIRHKPSGSILFFGRVTKP